MLPGLSASGALVFSEKTGYFYNHPVYLARMPAL
jgi:hypothetical protein